MRMAQMAVVAVVAGGLLIAAGCGSSVAAKTVKSSSSSARRFNSNPAIQAAEDIIRLQPVVPFSHVQVNEIVPILQQLASNPAASSGTLSKDAATIKGYFTTVQTQALANMAAAGPGAGGFRPPSGASGTFFFRSGTGGGHFSGSRPFASLPSGTRPSGTRGGSTFSLAAIYNLAIRTLEGKAGASSSSNGSSVGGASSSTASG